MDAGTVSNTGKSRKTRPADTLRISSETEIIKSPESGPSSSSSKRRKPNATQQLVAKNVIPEPPDDLSRSDAVSDYFGKLLTQRDRDPVSKALVPWFCDVLQSESSRHEYMKVIRHFVGFLREQDVSPLWATGDDLRLYKEARKQAGDRPATISQALSVLRGVYRQLGKHHLVPWNSVADIEAVVSPRVDKNTTPALTAKQASALLNAPDTDTLIGLRDHAMLYTFFYTAFRVSAMVSAKIGGLEDVDGQWYVNVTEKRNKERRLELLDATPAVLRWIREVGLEGQADWPLFPAFAPNKATLVNRHLNRETVRYMVKKYGRRAGINVDGIIQADGRKRRGIGAHSLRKTAATDALNNGAEMSDVQQWLGHSNIQTTQLYKQNTGEESKRAARHVKIR